jgi:5-methylcytosine-specific restriction protein A
LSISAPVHCGRCKYDAASFAADPAINARSLIDIHHIDPLAEGVCETTFADLRLACPNCHRFVHAKARTLNDPEQKRAGLRI